MPAPLEDLERGAVCLALFPYTFGFPLDRIQRDTEDELLAQLDRVEDIDAIEKTIRAGDEPEVVTKLKLRRLVLLQTGTDGRLSEVMAARVSSISDRMRERAGFYGRLTDGRHPTAVLLAGAGHHGTAGRDAYVNLINVAPIAKNAILRRTGQLDDDEMRQVTDRLITSLELDISHRIGDAD